MPLPVRPPSTTSSHPVSWSPRRPTTRRRAASPDGHGGGPPASTLIARRSHHLSPCGWPPAAPSSAGMSFSCCGVTRRRRAQQRDQQYCHQPSDCPVIASTGAYVGHACWRPAGGSTPSGLKSGPPNATAGTSGTTTTQTNARLATGTRRLPGPVGTPKAGSAKVASRTDGLRPFRARCARAIDHACAALSRGCPAGGSSLALDESRRSARR